MEEGEHMFKENAATLSNKIMFFVDIGILIIIASLYGVGRDSSWKVSWDGLLLTFIIIRAIFIGFRIALWWVDSNISQVSGYFSLFFYIFWVPTMFIYYCIELESFFRSDNDDWKSNASVIWGASLVIAIEGLIVLAVYALLLTIFSIWLITLVLKSCKNTDEGNDNEREMRGGSIVAASHIK